VDRELRELEREAASGDADAVERLEAMRERVRVRHPFLLNFTGRAVLPGNPIDGAPFGEAYLWLNANGSYDFDLGSILPRDGILKNIIIQTDQVTEQSYQIGIFKMHMISGKNRLAAATLKEGVQQACLAPLKGEIIIPKMTPFGVRLKRSSGDQRSKFDAIHIALEIWM
jgi:hypothetical protein